MLRRNFSLIEILVVLAIMALIAAVALPVLFSSSDFDKRDCEEKIKEAFDTAQLRAQAFGFKVTVTITEKDGGGYKLQISEGKLSTYNEDGTPATAGEEELGEDGVPAADENQQFWSGGNTFELDRTIEIDNWADLVEQDSDEDEQPRLRYIFYPSGEADGEPIVLRGKGWAMSLSVDRLTGRVELKDYEE